VAWAASTTLASIELPRVGLLSRLVLQLRGTTTLSATGVLTDLGPWAITARARVNVNIGAAALVDTSGYGLYMAQPIIEELGWRPDYTGIFAGTGAGSPPAPNADIHAAPVASGANTWVISQVVPISANSGREFELGLINLQAPEVRCTVDLTCGAGADFVSNFTSFVGSYFVYEEYYEIPDPRQFTLPPLALVRLLEEQQAIVGTGDTIYTVPRQGVLFQLAHRVTLNGARIDSPGWDSVAIRFNKTDTVYKEDRQWKRVQERIWYGMLPLVGVYYHDFWHAGSDVSVGDSRDQIDSEELSTLESVVTINSGATLGSNNNFLGSVRRIAQILQ
jgi:hypothetical protein